MIQLKVYPDSPKDNTEALFLDLYETQPIKLTLSIEDITSAEATSVFSRTFKVPATAHNAEFFENAFAIQGVLYDITIKKPAEILVDGQEFRQGHIRLQKIFINGDEEKIDYELLFLGETRDFSSAVGENTMCQLTLTDFEWENLPVNYTNAADFTGFPDYAKTTGSWQAYPEGGLTDGIADGDLLFPLIDHGNTYDDSGVPQQGQVSLSTSGDNKGFIQPSNSISTGRLKPMFRAKRLWDQIFENAGYTYQSDFLDSDRFRHMYVSAFGNTETIGLSVDDVNLLVSQYFESGANSNNDVDSYGYFSNQVIADPQGGYQVGIPDTGGPVGGSYYTAQGDAGSGGSYFAMEGGGRVDAKLEDSDQGFVDIPVQAKLVIVNQVGGTILHTLATGNATSGGNWSFFSYDSRNGGYQPNAGDIFQIIFESTGSYDNSEVGQAYWHVDAAPGEYYPLRDLDCEYQQIDYIKDLITMFRLVMQPDPTRPNHFIIEPWQEFIGSGDTFDWTDKLDHQKDVIAEPVFNTQSAVIEFTKAEDEDLLNKFHQDNNKHAYGWLRFNSQNELLKGKRDIEVTGISPTPLDQINHGGGASHPYPQWVLPTIIEVTGDNNDRLPIKPNTRFLFYNGLQDVEVTQDNWYLTAGASANAQNKWPLVSSYENWPVQQTSLNLNFSNDTRYYIDPDPGTGYFDQGQTLFDSFWARYIDTLYNKFSRRVTANFILDSTDLQNLSFDDLIFVDGVYYRPEKINNAEVGNKTSVKCELITVLDARPNWRDETLTGVSILGVAPPCSDGLGSISIQQDGTPPLLAELDNGQTANFNAPAGQAPYNWSMPGVSPGTYEITLTDSLNRQWFQTIVVPVSTATPVSFGLGITNPTVCDAPCNGELAVTPSGGSGSYTILWDDGAQNLVRSALCEGSYSFTLTDTNGCSIEGNATLECNAPPSEDQYLVQELQQGSVEVLLGNIFTNPNVNGTNDFHCAIVNSSDYTNFPAYDWQWGEISPYWQFEGPYNYGLRENPNVINAGINPNVPYFRGGSRQWNIPAGWVGTLKIVNDLELTNVQGLDLSQDNLYWKVIVDGVHQPVFDVPLPTLPTDGSVVPFYNEYEYVSDGSASVLIQFFLRYKDLPPLQPVGPVVGYRGTAQWFSVDPCTLNPTEYSIKSLTALNTGDVIQLTGLEGCYEVTGTTALPPVADFTNLYTDCVDCFENMPIQYNSWKLELYTGICDETGTYIYGDAGVYPIAAGDFVNIPGSTDCYKVIEQSLNSPTDLILQSRFADCAECQSAANGYNYIVELCESGLLNQATAPVNNLVPGRVYKMLDGINIGKCVEIISLSGSGGDNIDSATIYKDCNVCEGGPSATQYFSNRSEAQGTFSPVCAVSTVFTIYTDSAAPVPDLLIPGDRMFVDSALTQPWDGNNLYYALAAFSGTNNSTAAIQIDSNGYVVNNIVC